MICTASIYIPLPKKRICLLRNASRDVTPPSFGGAGGRRTSKDCWPARVPDREKWMNDPRRFERRKLKLSLRVYSRVPYGSSRRLTELKPTRGAAAHGPVFATGSFARLDLHLVSSSDLKQSRISFRHLRHRCRCVEPGVTDRVIHCYRRYTNVASPE